MLYEPAVATPALGAAKREVVTVTASSTPSCWCRRSVHCHLVDGSWQGVALSAVVNTNEPLRKLNSEGLKSLPVPTECVRLALPHEDECIGDAGVHSIPEDVPVQGEHSAVINVHDNLHVLGY